MGATINSKDLIFNPWEGEMGDAQCSMTPFKKPFEIKLMIVSVNMEVLVDPAIEKLNKEQLLKMS